jgi:beta-glucosidase
VLLKNDNRTLPFSQALGKIAVIGPLGDSGADTLGPWGAVGAPDAAITLVEGMRIAGAPLTEIVSHSGGTIDRSTPADIAGALKVARAADAVVLALGERATHSGEAASRSAIDLPGDQMALARAVLALGKPTAVVLFNGRPLTIEDLHKEAPAILEAWFPGSMGGLAAARILMGKAEPQGRLPMTFPRSVGQIPIYHDHRPTGRPAGDTPKPYTSTYIDKEPSPLYPFGYGLAYTDFVYGKPRTDAPVLGAKGSLTVSVDVMNVGQREGTAMVQLYINHRVARVSRPVRELRDFGRLTLAPQEVGTITMTLTERDLAFWQPDGRFAPPDAGVIGILTGPHAGELRTTFVDYNPKALPATSAIPKQALN